MTQKEKQAISNYLFSLKENLNQCQDYKSCKMILDQITNNQYAFLQDLSSIRITNYEDYLYYTQEYQNIIPNPREQLNLTYVGNLNQNKPRPSTGRLYPQQNYQALSNQNNGQGIYY